MQENSGYPPRNRAFETFQTFTTGCYACDNRAGNWMYYNGSPVGLALLYTQGYITDPKVFYCPGLLNQADEGGIQNAKGWGASGPNNYTVSSYYYRYVAGAVPAIASEGLIYDSPTAGQDVRSYKADINVVVDRAPSALWCSCHRGMYHPDGYNVLSYNGSVRFLNKSQWPLGFPRNVWWDWTDCWGNEGDGKGLSTYPDFEFWKVADRVW